MSKIAFSLGPLHFYWYGLIIAAAILAAYLITFVHARRSGEPLAPIVDLVLFSVPAGLAGARFAYVLANWALYWDNPLTVICLWQGGLSLHGALFAFLLVLYLYTRQTGLSFWRWADLCAPGLALAVLIGEWANFFNQEAFGYPTDRPWGIYIDFALRPAGYEQFDFFHPVFMYESAYNGLLFLLLAALAFWRHKTGRLRPGTIFQLAILLFAAGHFVFAGMRLDNETIQSIFLTRLVSGFLAAAALFLLTRPANPMSPLQRVQDFLGQYPDLSIILFDSSTHTSELAAQALGVKPAQIAKTLCFLADGRPVLLTACGDTRTDTKELARVLGVKKVRFADAETVEKETGFPPGGVSPVGILPGVPLYLDKSLWQFDTVFAAAGTANSALPVSPDRLREITGAEVIEVCK